MDVMSSHTQPPLGRLIKGLRLCFPGVGEWGQGRAPSSGVQGEGSSGSVGTEKGEEKRATSSGAQVCPKPAHLLPSDSHKIGIRTPTADEEGIQFSRLLLQQEQ